MTCTLRTDGEQFVSLCSVYLGLRYWVVERVGPNCSIMLFFVWLLTNLYCEPHELKLSLDCGVSRNCNEDDFQCGEPSSLHALIFILGLLLLWVLCHKCPPPPPFLPLESPLFCLPWQNQTKLWKNTLNILLHWPAYMALSSTLSQNCDYIKDLTV